MLRVLKAPKGYSGFAQAKVNNFFSLVFQYDALEHFYKILMAISNIPEALLTSLLDFRGSTFSAYFSTCNICKFFLFFSHTHCHSEKNTYSEDTEIILSYDLWMTACFQSCITKSTERNKNKYIWNEFLVTKNCSLPAGAKTFWSYCHLQDENINILLVVTQESNIQMRTLWNCTWPMFSPLHSTRRMSKI